MALRKVTDNENREFSYPCTMMYKVWLVVRFEV